MRKNSETYTVNGMDIQVNVVDDSVEARTMKMESNYRIKFAKDSEIPCEGRFHCSIASAEPVIPHKVYEAMLSAVKQHAKAVTPKPTRAKSTTKTA